ncbi:MAG: metallophosphoesterase [Chlamydiota bacterium]
MSVFALSDLHLSFGTTGKSMEVFGSQWLHYTQKIETSWRKKISSQDLVLIPGDISWAIRLEQALPDLEWIHNLPGTKLLIRGNHDFWWSSLKKVQDILPPSLHVLQNTAFLWNDIAVAGSRLWDTPEYSFSSAIEFTLPLTTEKKSLPPEDEVIFTRELQRLEMSLSQMSSSAKTRIAMTHYPPIGLDLFPSKTSLLFQKYKINISVFGHLHSLKKGIKLFGEKKEGIEYYLTSCDYLDFSPLQIL